MTISIFDYEKKSTEIKFDFILLPQSQRVIKNGERSKNYLQRMNSSLIMSTNNEKNLNEASDSEQVLNQKKPENVPCRAKSRKLHKSYVTAWKEDLEKKGFARCIIATCNFIALNLRSIEAHHKYCNGVPCHDGNYCNVCKCCFGCQKEFKQHFANCEKVNKFRALKCEKTENEEESTIEENVSNSRLKNCSNEIDAQGINTKNIQPGKVTKVDIQSSPKVKKLQSYQCDKCSKGFLLKKDYSAHVSSCRCSSKLVQPQSKEKKSEKLHFSKIKKFKEKLNPDCIIQPCPNSSDGQYRRRRSYTKQHKNTWMTTLEKSKYVKCIFQNCHFIAMSLEDMISHFGYCNGDGTFAKFECPKCRGRVTSEEILKIHIKRSHKQTNSEELNDDDGTSAQRNGSDSRKRGNSASEPIKYGKKSSEEISGVKREEDKTLRGEEKDSFAMEKSVKNSTRSVNRGSGRKIYSRKRKSNLDPTKEEDDESKKGGKQEISDSVGEGIPGVKKRKRESIGFDEASGSNRSKSFAEEIRCGKCDFVGSSKSFENHNRRKHVGLGWIEGETPVDMTNEKEIVKLVKWAFKLTKKGTCELCQEVKRSFMGFVSHVQNCGKSEEEKDAIKAQCPHCPVKCLRYSLPIHIKLSHSRRPQEEGGSVEEREEEENCAVSSGRKRKSALRAATKFHEVLNEIDEVETVEAGYVLFEKDSDKFPKVCSKLNNVWYKNQKNGEKIVCRRVGCDFSSDSAREAKLHHFTCPILPDKVYMCEGCEFFSENETEMRSHVSVHRNKRTSKKRKTNGDKVGEERGSGTDGEEDSEDGPEEEPDEEEEGEEDDDDAEGEDEEGEDENSDIEDAGNSSRKRKRKKNQSEGKKGKKIFKMDDELFHRKNFCTRENLENHRGLPFFGYGLKMTLEEEEAEEKEKFVESNSLPQFQTRPTDWLPVSIKSTSPGFLPEWNSSVSVAAFDENEKRTKWKRFDRFEGDLIRGVPIMFVGGSVRCLSWCKISHGRSIRERSNQYLALTTAKVSNHLRNIHDRCLPSTRSLLQIWNCTDLENAEARKPPTFSLGIPHEGEIWDLAWFPEDTSAEGGNGYLPRLGLLATASGDGAVRIWSICDPDRLERDDWPPIFETNPVVKLITDDDLEDVCFRLSIGRNGIVAGGFANGLVALWNLKNVSSPFCKKVGNCGVIKSHLTIQAHRTVVTALTFCPTDSRFISTGALDRIVKLWDLESPASPVEQYGRDLCLNSVWPKNWPLIFYNFDEVMPNGKKGVIRFVKNIFYDRQYPCLALDNFCLSISFSDWLNALSGSSDSGEIKVRYLKNLICDQKKQSSQEAVSSLRVRKLNGEKYEDEKKSDSKMADGEKSGKDEKEDGKTDFQSYEEFNSKFGLDFVDGESAVEKSKQKKAVEFRYGKFPIEAVNAVSFNPNFKSFTHLAAGYNCGFVRIPCLKRLQSNYYLKSFLQRHSAESTPNK